MVRVQYGPSDLESVRLVVKNYSDKWVHNWDDDSYMESGGEFADMRNMLTCLFLFAPDGPRGDCHSGSVAACGEIRQLFLCGKFY